MGGRLSLYTRGMMAQTRNPHMGIILGNPHRHDRHISLARTLPAKAQRRALNHLQGARIRRAIGRNRPIDLGEHWYMVDGDMETLFVFVPQDGVTAQQAAQLIATDCITAYCLPWPDEGARRLLLPPGLPRAIIQRSYP